MIVYLHKYYEDGELLMELFLPHATPIEWDVQFDIQKIEVEPTRQDDVLYGARNVWFNYQGEEHVVLIDA